MRLGFRRSGLVFVVHLRLRGRSCLEVWLGRFGLWLTLRLTKSGSIKTPGEV